jgi:CSLREA domain-containing protein
MLGVAAAVLLCCALPSVAAAQGVVVVNTTSDHLPDGSCAALPVGDCTLREAIEQNPAAEIEVPVGDYELDLGGLGIGRDVAIRGTGNGLPRLHPFVESQTRVLVIGSDTTVQLSRLRITGGHTTGSVGGSWWNPQPPSCSRTARSRGTPPWTEAGSGPMERSR